jgi:hypothetical protein
MKKLSYKKIFFIFIYKMMITKFKIFETINGQPNQGDYVILDAEDKDKEFGEFVSNNVGKIIQIGREHGGNGKVFLVKWENIPERLKYEQRNFFYKDGTRECTAQHFKYWSDNKEELETLINAEKYNL